MLGIYKKNTRRFFCINTLARRLHLFCILKTQMGVPQTPNPPHLSPALQLKLYQAFIFSIPILFSIILLLLFYLFYLKRRASTLSYPPPILSRSPIPASPYFTSVRSLSLSLSLSHTHTHTYTQYCIPYMQAHIQIEKQVQYGIMWFFFFFLVCVIE